MIKYIYIFFCVLSSNIVAGEKIIYEKKIHSDSVDSLCLNGKEIITASFDHTIKRTINNESKFVGEHKDWVRKVICIDKNMISASNDGTISIWNGFKKIRSVQAHEWWITDIDFYDDKIVSVSLDETVKVWSYPKLKLLYSHKIYGSNKLHSVIINNRKAFIGSTNGRMYVLDMKKFNIIGKIWVDRLGRSILTSSAKSLKYVFFGTSNGLIARITTSSPYKVVFKKKTSDFAVKAIALYQGDLYIGDDNGVLRKLNMKNLKNKQIVHDSSEAIRTITIDNNIIYAGYDNGYIRKFNLNTDISDK